MRSQSGTPSYSKGFTGAQFWPRAMRAAAKKLFFLLSILPPLLLWSSEACAQSTSPPATTPPEVQQNATPSTTNAVPEVPTPNVLPAPAPPRPVLSTQGTLPAAIVPALETRVGFSTLSRVSSPNNRILFNGMNASVTKQASERFGATLEVSYLRASNVFGTGQSNSVLTYLIGPVYYPYRKNGLLASVHALGGGARVAGVVALLPNSSGLLKGTVNDRAWSFGGGVEKWVTNLLAVRVDIDALHTTFFNSSAKVHGEYDLRATWGVIYYFGQRGKSGKLRNFAGRQIE